MPTVEAEERIMVAVEKVGKKVDDLAKTTGVFILSSTDRLARIEEKEMSCPINTVVDTLRDVEKSAEEAKRESRRTSALIAAGIGGVWTALLAAFRWNQSGGNG